MKDRSGLASWFRLNLRQLFIFLLVSIIYVVLELSDIKLFADKEKQNLFFVTGITLGFVLFSRYKWFDRLPYLITITGLIYAIVTRHHMASNDLAALFGLAMVAVLVLGVSSILYIEKHQESIKNWKMWFTIIGYLLSVWVIYSFMMPVIF